jgi:hypothetical protein
MYHLPGPGRDTTVTRERVARDVRRATVSRTPPR